MKPIHSWHIMIADSSIDGNVENVFACRRADPIEPRKNSVHESPKKLSSNENEMPMSVVKCKTFCTALSGATKECRLPDYVGGHILARSRRCSSKLINLISNLWR